MFGNYFLHLGEVIKGNCHVNDFVTASINTEKSYYDTNTSNHHHFFNESTNELIDLQDNEIGKINLKKTLPKKKIKSVEVLVKIIDSN